ncbi:hypothetical protein HELRODRAFT_193057 [Helobdella robusta]|uniref:EGF-like domain-containing protein n=1 Tax=Helobdella robusta TaxID=6412 RepID=T1FUL0_HELRO|nr:hypothetical protein HELRODRAFT_193057 [Helobdella robusta]ESN98357.1 hypothetical protein HELRODRAFT_193057 [Helobdella robusta]
MNLPLVLLLSFLSGAPLVVSDCRNHNCQNGGTCVPQDQGFKWDYHCECPAGYKGEQCQWDDTSVCVDNTITPCKNGGICKNGINSGERYCDCPGKNATWFKYGGHYCELIDPCTTCPYGTKICQSIPTQKSGRFCLDNSKREYFA